MFENARDADGDSVSTDDVFRALASARRRSVLRSLHRTGRRSLADLAEAVAATEHGRRASGPRGDDLTVRRYDLHHCAVPALARAGPVERDGGAVGLSHRVPRSPPGPGRPSPVATRRRPADRIGT